MQVDGHPIECPVDGFRHREGQRFGEVFQGFDQGTKKQQDGYKYRACYGKSVAGSQFIQAIARHPLDLGIDSQGRRGGVWARPGEGVAEPVKYDCQQYDGDAALKTRPGVHLP